MHPSVHAAAEHGPVDLAMICVPAPACAGVLAEAAAAGARAAVICGGGFAEAGGPGVAYQRALADVVSATGIRLLGPNTSGFLAPHAGVTASFVPGVARVRPGRVGLVAASGGVNHALAFLLAEAGHGVSLAVGLGNAVDVGAPEVLEHLAEDPHTAAVALHVESVADGPRLVAAVRRLAARRPVVALVVGRHDVGAFAASHTGALATSWRTARAALAQAGAVLVDDALDRLDAIGARGYLVEAMAPSGIDLVLGARRDPVFGPVVLFGLGGTAAEALADVAIRLAPLTMAEAAAMPDGLAGQMLLGGWRGGPALDPLELGRLVAALGDLLVANPALDDIEVNPLRLTDHGLIALDAVIITHGA